MARQVTLFLHPDDEPDFDRFLKSFGEVVLIPERQRTEAVTTAPDTLTASRGGVDVEGSRIYLVRPADLAGVRLRYLANRGYWLVDDAPLAALHFDRCILRSDRLLQGRLFFEPRFVANLQWVDKPAEFVRWADEIIRATRKKLPKLTLPVAGATFSAHFGTAAQAWQRERNAGLRAGCAALLAADAVFTH